MDRELGLRVWKTYAISTIGSLAWLFLGVTGHVMAEDPSASRPNILVIITDQQFADVMGCAGCSGIETPAMDSLAKEGVRFTRAYVNYPVCLPERYTMFTGRLPCTRRQADSANKPLISLGNQAKKGGYETAYFGKWHIQDQTFGRDDVAHHGFDSNVGGRDIDMTDDAVQFLSRAGRKPFLAVVSYYNPHDICEWGRKKAGRNAGITMRNGDVDIDPPLDRCPPLPDNFQINGDESEAVQVRRTLSSKGVRNAQSMAMDFSDDDWRQYRWAYHQLVELVDKQIARVLSALDDKGLADKTVVIFTSDHGDGYAAHRWHQKSVLYEESCRVPFVVRWPRGVRRNETDDRLISVGIDLMPTISDIVGVRMPEGPYFGKSAWPFVLDASSPAPTHEYVVTEAEVRLGPKHSYQGRSLRTPDCKYHLWSRGKNREQLFDMVNDPGETRNLVDSPEYATQLAKHRDLFAQWLKKTDDTYRENEKQLPFWDKSKAFVGIKHPVLYNLRTDREETSDVASAHPKIVQEMLEQAESMRGELGEYMQRGSEQRRTGSVVPGAPIISHEKDWDMVAPAMVETIADERQSRYPIRKQTGIRRKKEK